PTASCPDAGAARALVTFASTVLSTSNGCVGVSSSRAAGVPVPTVSIDAPHCGQKRIDAGAMSAPQRGQIMRVAWPRGPVRMIAPVRLLPRGVAARTGSGQVRCDPDESATRPAHHGQKIGSHLRHAKGTSIALHTSYGAPELGSQVRCR